MKTTLKKVLLFIALCMAFAFAPIFNSSVTAYAATDDEIALSESSITLAPARYKQLTLEGADGTVKWLTSNDSVAIVTSSGKVYAKKKGTAVITAKTKVDGVWQKYTCTVKVKYQTKTYDGIEYKDVSGTFATSGKWYTRSFGGKKYQATSTAGSSFYFKTTGTKKVTIKFAFSTSLNKPRIAYSIDGKDFQYKNVGSKVTLNLGNAKTHYVRVVLDSVSPYEDRWIGNGALAVKSITANTASTGVVTAIAPQNPVVVFYGDSITEGIRTIGDGLNTSGSSATHSYAWYTAEKLGAIPYMVGFASCGITETGSFSKAYNIVTYNMDGSKTTSYPTNVGAIVVEFGANDASCSDSDFQSGYQTLIKKIHKLYSSAKIVCVRPPFSDRNGASISTIAAKYSYASELTTSTLNLGTYDNIHPNASGAKKIAKALAKKIKAVTDYYN
ncbi:MAG: Ig-like domain-containing protein [Lachnospiraceae bacterium]|nr:Ig-like domain-containing protein [Lachnospiraceae bacterium]